MKKYENNIEINRAEFDSFSRASWSGKPEIGITDKDKSIISKYFAQYGSKVDTLPVGGHGPLVDTKFLSARVNQRHFSIYRIVTGTSMADDDWFLMSVFIPDQHVSVKKEEYDEWLSKGQPSDVDGKFRYWKWDKSTDSGDSKYMRIVGEKTYYYKCDQIEGVIDQLDEILTKHRKKSPEVFFSKEKEKEDLKKLKNDMVSKVRRMSREQLLKFKDFNPNI